MQNRAYTQHYKLNICRPTIVSIKYLRQDGCGFDCVDLFVG